MKASRLHDCERDPGTEDAPVPSIGPDDVLVRVQATSLNPIDLKVQSGMVRVLSIELP